MGAASTTSTAPGPNTNARAPDSVACVCVEECTSVFYQDVDDDGFGNPNSTLIGCRSPVGYRVNSLDCCDSDALARPNQTDFFGTANGCGSFDYDCDGAAERRSVLLSNATSCVEQGVFSTRTAAWSGIPTWCRHLRLRRVDHTKHVRLGGSAPGQRGLPARNPTRHSGVPLAAKSGGGAQSNPHELLRQHRVNELPTEACMGATNRAVHTSAGASASPRRSAAWPGCPRPGR